MLFATTANAKKACKTVGAPVVGCFIWGV